MIDLISRQAVLNLLHALPPEEVTTKALLIQSVKQMDAPDNLVKDSQCLAKDLVNDCISRKAAIDAIFGRSHEIIKMRIGNLPSVQPERNRGKWLADNRPGGGFWVCSCCKFPSEAFAADVLYKYCPNCGADMRGEQDG